MERRHLPYTAVLNALSKPTMLKILNITFLVVFCCAAGLAVEGHKKPSGLRIISMAPSTTEILFELGAGDNIVGVSQFCDYPPEAKHKEKVGSFSQPNIERILSLEPNMVFCTGLEQAPTITKLRQLGIRVEVSDPASIDELYVSIEKIGSMIEKNIEAGSVIKKMRDKIAAVRLSVESRIEEDKPKVFVEIWHEPLMTAGKGSFVGELIELAGGKNIADDSSMPYSRYSVERVIFHDPELIILGYMQSGVDPSGIMASRVGWGNITAVKNGNVCNDIAPELYFRAGPRLAAGLEEIHKRISRL